MDTMEAMNRRRPILVQALFVFTWLSNFYYVERFLPLYLFWGICGIFCLWNNQTDAFVGRGENVLLGLVSLGLSAGAIWFNLAAFQPVAALLSICNMLVSAIGCAIASYHILLWMISVPKRQAAVSSLVQILAIYLCLVVLMPTDARYNVYVLCGLLGTMCICHNQERNYVPGKRTRRVLLIFAGLFALAISLSNYALFEPFLQVRSLICCGITLLGGMVIGYHVLLAMMIRLPMTESEENRKYPWAVFAGTFVCVCLICLAYLFFCVYPGVLSRDSQSTVAQILGTQAYNNTMPFWHTITVQPFVELGMEWFGTKDAGIALFHCVQVLFMAMCFGYVLTTLYQIGVPKGILALVFFAYVCIPYNIVYSVTLWKDVPFSGCALLFVTALYRLINQAGRSRMLNYGMLLLGAIGFSLMRTNGWYAFLVTVLVMALVMDKKHRKLLIIMALVLILCWVMINPVLDALGVSETNLVEAFAIPMQQVARVVWEGRSLTQEETELLSGIFWLEEMAELYDPYTVDPIKFQTFRGDQVHRITEDPVTYLKLYFQLGIKYPGDYLKAWIDETVGYWNAGYDYWIYSLTSVKEQDNLISRAFVSVFRFLNETEALKMFSSVGLYIWGMIGCFVVNLLKKREAFLLSIPTLVLVAGLWIGTPVFCEFRYAYPVILTLPLVACVTLYQKPKEK